MNPVITPKALDQLPPASPIPSSGSNPTPIGMIEPVQPGKISEFRPARITPGGPKPVPSSFAKSGEEIPVTVGDVRTPPPGLPAIAVTPGVAPEPARIQPIRADDAPEERTPGTGVPRPEIQPLPTPPPIGSPPVSTTPPILIPTPVPGTAAPTSPVSVDSFDETAHRCRAGDTFESISTQYYRSQQFAEALRMYNRYHPQHAKNYQTEGTLPEGQVVFLPPAAILQARFRSLIPNEKETQPPTTGPMAIPVGGPPSTPLLNYRVVDQNEMIAAVAQKTLGDVMRWKEISALNPQIDSSKPVPVNTVLRLPADARVPMANAG
jgi:nucleoid-associated protein YgaU